MIKKFKRNYVNLIDFIYMKLFKFVSNATINMIPYFRRILRFMALPYCYVKLVNWRQCEASKFQVFKDFIYIFFILKYFPDNYSLCRFWEKLRSDWVYYYGSIYDPYQRGRLQRKVQKKEYNIVFQDKNICYQLCTAFNLPVPVQYGIITTEFDFFHFFENIFIKDPSTLLIVKPILGKGGVGIVQVFYRDGNIIIRDREAEILLKDYQFTTEAVVQKYISQHPKIQKISKSINTVRIVTLLTKHRRVIVVGAMMRFGVGASYIDNRCMGGMAAGIHLDSGKLMKFAYDFNHERHEAHPTSKIVFEGCEVPYWDQVVKLAKQIQMDFSFFKLLGHDIAITPGGPTIIEINDAHDNVGLEQAYGPIFSDKKVWEAFKEYDLLINNLCKNIY